jgi:hypothetical protein
MGHGLVKLGISSTALLAVEPTRIFEIRQHQSMADVPNGHAILR